MTQSNSRGAREPKSEIRATAARYVARIHSGDLSATDEEEIRDWIEESAENQREFELMLELHDSTLGMVGGPGEQALLEVVSSEASNRRNSTSTWRWSAAAALALALAITLLYAPFTRNEPSVNRNEYATEVGEQYEVRLHDGSIVFLNTNTRLGVTFTADVRQIELTRGEAYFDVVHEEQRPFTVSSPGGSVTALGTEFNVMLASAATKVAVTEGAVALHSELIPTSQVLAQWRGSHQSGNAEDDKIIILEVGSTATMNAQAISIAQAAKPEQLGQWRTGFLRFENRSLSSLIDELARYTNDSIEFEDPEVARRTITGLLNLRDIDNVWMGLEATADISVVRLPGRVILTDRSSEQSRDTHFD